ncbi:MAG: ATP-dependent RNA helicase DbpA [Helicobacteraceae bacterium]|nr:ATP-dependent RNA helicase DbpA [Helicobacteraceae bacterium]
MSNNFSNLSLSEPMIANLTKIGYTTMTPVQEEALPIALEGNDLIAQAKTGSGKTAAFGIPILHTLKTEEFKLQAVIMCPTRELSHQVADELRSLGKFKENIKILSLVGGEPVYGQQKALESGVHIAVGTPGRIMDHITKGNLKFDSMKMLVLDEADRMLDMGFLDDIKAIIEYMPAQRQTLLFSATFEDEIEKLSKQFQRDAKFVKVSSDDDEVNVEQHFFKVRENEKIDLVEALLTSNKISACLIFCNMKITCDEVAKSLYDRGFDSMALHGDLEQRDRNEALTLFSNGTINILVATDVAARGLDIKELPCVINYDISHKAEVHIHRIGRTARAGAEGVAYTMFSDREQKFCDAIEEYSDRSFELQNQNSVQNNKKFNKNAPNVTIKILGGKKNKLRAGDLVGALIAEFKIKSENLGKITVLDKVSYVAIDRDASSKISFRGDRIKVKGKIFRFINI